MIDLGAIKARDAEWDDRLALLVGLPVNQLGECVLDRRVLLAEVTRLRAELAAAAEREQRVRAVWSEYRDTEDGTMPWRLVRDMDAALNGPEGDTR